MTNSENWRERAWPGNVSRIRRFSRRRSFTKRICESPAASASGAGIGAGTSLPRPALAMRRILVERARHYQRIKHGSGAERVDLDSAIARADPSLTDLVAVDEALTRLEQSDPRKAQIVSLRYFAGLSIEETAAALDLSAATG